MRVELHIDGPEELKGAIAALKAVAALAKALGDDAFEHGRRPIEERAAAAGTLHGLAAILASHVAELEKTEIAISVH